LSYHVVTNSFFQLPRGTMIDFFQSPQGLKWPK
jgi:hypothetical protein